VESQDRDQERKQWIADRYKALLQRQESKRTEWRAVKSEFMEKFKATVQVWNNLSGKVLEDVIAGEFIHQLASKQGVQQCLLVQRWDNLQEIVKQILSEQLWARGELMEPYLVESNVDFIAIERENEQPMRVLAVYSCKASLRERFQQDMFWADRLRSRGIRFCLITLDLDGALLKIIQHGQKGLTRNKQAKMGIAFYDRIYLPDPDHEIKHFKRVFRPIYSLVEDLARWLRD